MPGHGPTIAVDVRSILVADITSCPATDRRCSKDGHGPTIAVDVRSILVADITSCPATDRRWSKDRHGPTVAVHVGPSCSLSSLHALPRIDAVLKTDTGRQ